MQMYRDIPDDMRALVEPIVVEHGLELVDVEQRGGRGPHLVRVVVDNPSGDGRVGVDLCAQVSREVATNLDAASQIDARYTLEVTSPGLDRTLAREKDFAAACGRAVKVETRQPIDGSRRFRGELVSFIDGIARIEMDGAQVAIPFEEVSRAQTVYEFTREDFAAQGGKRSSAAKGRKAASREEVR
jgi:ribosome maturation factor RimP